jgi:hypothetical protein
LLHNGKVLVAGGHAAFAPIGVAELYDPRTGVWTNSGTLGTARYAHTADDAAQWQGARRWRLQQFLAIRSPDRSFTKSGGASPEEESFHDCTPQRVDRFYQRQC